jgi:surface polysaccharide O-acyltransferase-like enzyme
MAPSARDQFVFRMPFVRGAAILAVMFFHIFPAEPPVEWHSLSAWLVAAAVRLADFGVPVFVLLSGFYLSLNERNEKPRLLYRRTLKYFVVAYIAYSALYAIPAAAHGMTAGQLAHGFLTASIAAHLWFVPLIAELYLLHPALRRLYRRQPVLTVVAACLLQVAWPWFRDSGLLSSDVSRVPLWFCAEVAYFVGGYVLLDRADSASRLTTRRGGIITAAAIWIGLGVATTFIRVPGTWGSEGLRQLADHQIVLGLADLTRSIAAFLVVFGVGQRLGAWAPWAAAPISRFGLYSYGVYYLHPIAISISTRAVTFATGLTKQHVLWYLAVFLVTAPVSLLMTRWLSRYQVARYLM